MRMSHTPHSELTTEQPSGSTGIPLDSSRLIHKRKSRTSKRHKSIIVKSPRLSSRGVVHRGISNPLQVSQEPTAASDALLEDPPAGTDVSVFPDICAAPAAPEFTGSLGYDFLLPVLLSMKGGAVYAAYLTLGALSLVILLVASELSLAPVAGLLITTFYDGGQSDFVFSACLFAAVRLLLAPLLLAVLALPVRAFFLNGQVLLGLLIAETPRATYRALTTSWRLLLRVMVRIVIVYLTSQTAVLLLDGLVSPSILNFAAAFCTIIYCGSRLSLLCAPIVSIIGDYDAGYSLAITPFILAAARSRIWAIVACSVVGMGCCHLLLHGLLSVFSSPSHHATLFIVNTIIWLWFGVIALSSVVLSETYSFERRCYLSK
jgi:hypothetical protein